ncbi:MAG: glycogen/starch/alpha-glucan phosphorylase, partial [Firmicutes bacterium]|nr:glycogen/starch/alpha-glucan phosphorylase [Bacillota bacterium]
AGVGGDFWGIYDPLLRNNDEYFVLKDFDSYLTAWNSLSELYKDERAWRQVSLRNIAKAGYFSSDRTIAEYVKDIWHL